MSGGAERQCDRALIEPFLFVSISTKAFRSCALFIWMLSLAASCCTYVHADL
jgi:hypothetical protein